MFEGVAAVVVKVNVGLNVWSLLRNVKVFELRPTVMVGSAGESDTVSSAGPA